MATNSKIPAKAPPEKEGDNYTSAFLPNELDALDSPTYHFRLFLTTPQNFTKQCFGNNVSGEQITIAETAVTTIGIDDVEIMSIPGTSSDAFTGTSTTVNFTLKQPMGANLLDMIYYSSVELGVENYLKCPYYLELTFKGRNPKTGLPFTATEKRVWELAIVSMDIDVDSSGSTYTVKAVSSDNLGTTHQYANLRTGVSFPVSTVGEFFAKFKQVLDDQAKDKNRADEYDFSIDNDISNQVLRNKKPDESPELAGDFKVDNNKHTTVSFGDGTDILRVIDSILSVTDYFQKEIKLTTDPDDNSATKKETIWKKLYRIVPEVTYTSYNPDSGDYNRKFMYHVTQYQLTTISSATSEVSELKNSDKRIKEYIGTNVLRKHYNYLFTGLNQSIQKFDMKFNFAWFSAIPIKGGNSTTSSVTGGYSRQVSASGYVLKSSSNIESEDNKRCKLAANPVPVDAIMSGFVDIGTLTEVPTTTTEPNSTPSVGKKSRIAPPSYSQETTSARTKKILDQAGNSKIQLPLTTIPSNQTLDNNFGVEDTSGAGRTLLSGLFTGAMHNDNADLLSIVLEIKGDPFWINPPPLKLEAITRVAVADQIAAESQRHQMKTIGDKTTENYLLFTSQTPVMDVITGEQVGGGFTQNSVINGIYGIIKVDHLFSGGVFTQKLQCVREQFTDVDDTIVKAFISEGLGDPSIVNANRRTNPNNAVNDIAPPATNVNDGVFASSSSSTA